MSDTASSGTDFMERVRESHPLRFGNLMDHCQQIQRADRLAQEIRQREQIFIPTPEAAGEPNVGPVLF
eukprot:14571711-Alexandrium_andersonii.AAC.1